MTSSFPRRMTKDTTPSQPTAAPQPVSQPAQPAPAGAGMAIKSPLPGTVTDIKVSVGQTIQAGDVVLVLEAMKMQNNIEAEHEGKVTAIYVNQGDTIMEGTVLMTIG